MLSDRLLGVFLDVFWEKKVKKGCFWAIKGIYLRVQRFDRLPAEGWSCGEPRFLAKMRKRIYKTLGEAKCTWIDAKSDMFRRISLSEGYWDQFSLNLTVKRLVAIVTNYASAYLFTR